VLIVVLALRPAGLLAEREIMSRARRAPLPASGPPALTSEEAG
jgi:hypothetical protein